ncbi:MAG: Fic family protein [Gemmatimonadota bacterium]
MDGTGRHLPNPALLLRPLQQREALRSSSLEGTYAEPSQQALFELDPGAGDPQTQTNSSGREVFNYVQALRLRRGDGSERRLSLHLIREFHATLLKGVRGADQNPGQFRTRQNQIGRPARFVPPPAHHLHDLLENLEEYLQRPEGLDPLVAAFVAHYQFETIHPFMDGNGRVGRLLLALTIQEWCQLSDQWLFMSPFFERRKDEYMDLMLGVSTDGRWTQWIDFCLEGVADQAGDAIARCERLLKLRRDFHERLRTQGGTKLQSIVDDLFITPAVRVTDVVSRSGVTYPTARTYLRRLERLGIVAEFPAAPQIAYICPAIIEATHSD